MKKINVDTLKSTTITETLPETKESVDSTIEDDSQEGLDATFKLLLTCNTSLKKAVAQLNSYMNSMAETFEEMDKNISLTIEKNTAEALKKPSKGLNRYSGLI